MGLISDLRGFLGAIWDSTSPCQTGGAMVVSFSPTIARRRPYFALGVTNAHGKVLNHATVRIYRSSEKRIVSARLKKKGFPVRADDSEANRNQNMERTRSREGILFVFLKSRTALTKQVLAL